MPCRLRAEKMRRIKLLELTDAQYERIAPLLPKRRGNVRWV